MALTFLERVETESPSTSQFAVDGGKSTSMWLLQGGTGVGGAVTVKDIQDAIVQILGTTAYGVGDGRLMRTPPLADPMFGWLFADSISSIKGVGEFVKTAAPADLEVPALPFFALYPAYWFTINFSPRPYPIFTDMKVTLSPYGRWFNFNGTPQYFLYVSEFERYLDYQIQPDFDSVIGQAGRMVFDSNTKLPVTPDDPTSPNTSKTPTPFLGNPRLQLPNQKLKLIWMNIPYRYVTSRNSFIRFFVGNVNQNFITLQGQTFYPAELQYIGYNPIKFTPPVQAVAGVVPGVFSTEKLCNIEMIFRYTNRYADDLPGPRNPGTPSEFLLPNGSPCYFQTNNKNFVMSGWNLLPWLNDRKFHYCRTDVSVGRFTPSWYSFPAEILGCDPDAAGAYQISTANQ